MASGTRMNRINVVRLVTFVLLSSWNSVAADEGVPSEEDVRQCNLYVAPSSTSTSEDLYWGLFAGRDYVENEIIEDYELAVNLFNIRLHNNFDKIEDHGVRDMIKFLDSYMWVPEMAGAKYESRDPKVSFVPGMGILAAQRKKMTNAKWDHFSSYRRPMVGEQPGVAHPGRGAITPFYNVAASATKNIKKGSEIFLNYGSNYEESDSEKKLDPLEYKQLDETIVKMVEFFKKHENDMNEEAKGLIYSFLTNDVMSAAVGKLQVAVSRILPPTPDHLQDIIDAGGSMSFDTEAPKHSIEWLERNGFCADNIKYGASTIKDAGRGAFATRNLKSGSTVAVSPLIPIPDLAVFEMFPIVVNKYGVQEAKRDEATLGHQLLVNYCFSHSDSTMGFLPAGPSVAFINHNSEPNVRLKWSDHSESRKDWMDLEPFHLVEEEHAYLGLILEVVALRDIQQGEEIFLDYGKDWVEAWDKHLANWRNTNADSHWPLKAIDLNHKYRTEPFPTETEDSHAFPENVSLVAFIMVVEANSGSREKPRQWDKPAKGTVYDEENLFEIEIRERTPVPESMSFNYTVVWINNADEEIYIANVPHEAIVFVDRPGTSDHFAPSAFRFPIGMPDDVFPQGPWRNLNDDEEDHEGGHEEDHEESED